MDWPRALALDALNFFLADVRGGVGPYLSVFLVTQQHWSQSEVGVSTTVSGFLAIALQSPIGVAIDLTRAKRGVVVAALVALAVSATAIFCLPTFWPVVVASCVMAVAGDTFGPAVGALTLGLFERSRLAERMGRNSAFDHAGNVVAAACAAAAGFAFGQPAVFLLVPAFALAAGAAVLAIPAGSIDHEHARDLEPGEASQTSSGAGLTVLLHRRPLLIFAGSALLFHFANAPLLPLVGQKLAAAHPREATAMMSACIVGAQVVMTPIALWVGRHADRLGRKPIFLVAFAVLPLRAALYPISGDSAWLLGVQLLDGVGAGIFGALAPLVVADVMRGSGRFNAAQGVVATAIGVGASLSGLASGAIVDRFGYSADFLALAAAATVALVVFAVWMPETAPKSSAPRSRLKGSIGEASL